MYSQNVIEDLPTLSSEIEQDDPPLMEELMSALGKLKKGKAGGRTGILPELPLAGGAELLENKVMESVWNKRKAVENWKYAEIVSIPQERGPQALR